MTVTNNNHQENGNTLSRRTLLQSAGIGAGLTVMWSTRTGAQGDPSTGGTPEAEANGGPDFSAQTDIPMEVDSYLTIHEDGSVTVLTGKVEFGQGIRTGFAQLVAEELSLPIDRVDVIMGTTDQTPFDGSTVGSMSLRMTGPRIRGAAAMMRHWLLELAAEQLDTAQDELTIEDGLISGPGDSDDNPLSFADLVAGQSLAREIEEDVALKDSSEYTVVGQDIPRPDVDSKVDGSAIFGIDAHVEGMVYGWTAYPPAFGATLESIDFTEAESMPGVIGTVHDGEFAGLIAERWDQLQAAIEVVDATWSEVDSSTTSENIYEVLRETADEGVPLDEEGEAGDPDTALADAAQPLSLTFRAPYVNHAPIEPKAALAVVNDDQVEVWTSTQDPRGIQGAVAEVLDRPVESVLVTPLFPGGAFGSKITPYTELEAALLAQEFDRPVKVVWNREQEFSHSQYRPAMEVEINTGLNDQGEIVGWKFESYAAAYFPEGAEEPTPAASDWSANIREIYNIPESQTTMYQGASPLAPRHWRVNGASNNTLAREVTLNQLAELADEDPVAFRKRYLDENPRMDALLDALVEHADWNPQVGSTGEGVGLALGFDADTYVAQLVRVAVDESTGEITVLHVDCAVDCGLIVNPEAVRHQAEGSIVQSISASLNEKITFEGGRVTNPSFGEYPMITMRQSPPIETIFVEDKNNPMGGAGEPIVAPVIAAIASAVYDATGVWLQETPFTPERVLEALENAEANRATVPA